MRYLTALLLIPALLLVISASSKSEFYEPRYGTVEVYVSAGLEPLAGASVALDLNNNGVWEESEPLDWTNEFGMVVFSNVTSVPDGGGPAVEWSPNGILTGNLRGTVGARDVSVDFALPAGSSTATLALFDLRGRRLAQVQGTGDLSLGMPANMPSGVYFMRLSADSADPVTLRITSVGQRARSIKAHRVSGAEALAAGWAGPRTPHQTQDKRSEDPQEINLIVAHDDYPPVVKPVLLDPGANSFSVNLLPNSVVVEPGGEGLIEITDPDDPLYGLIVVIPEGAVSEPTLFEVAYVSDPPPTGFPGLEPVGLVVDVTSSHGGLFSVPLEILLPVPDSVGPDDLPIATVFDTELGDWVVVRSEFSETREFVTAYTDHLSMFSLHLIPNPADFIEAIEQVADVRSNLSLLIGEIQGDMRCAVLQSYRNFFVSREALYREQLDTWEIIEGPCLDFCDDVYGQYGGLGGYFAHHLGEQIAGAGFTVVIGWLIGATAAAWAAAILAIGLIPGALCGLCQLWTFPTWASLYFGMTFCTLGIESVDQAILEYGCNDPTPPPGFVYIPPGTFTMGSPANEPQSISNERPQHQVTLTNGFYMSKYEVTEEWWYQVMGGTPTTSQLPKSSVSWDLAVQFCNALSLQQGLTPAYTIHGTAGDVTWNQIANGYRLPTEAEWEYACRATTTLAFNNNTNCLSSNTEANYDGRYPLTGCPTGVYRGAPTVVGSFPANQLGLYDMHGNLWEWVWCGGFREYTSSPQVDPVHNVDRGTARVLRGGFYNYNAQYCRSAHRAGAGPGLGSVSIGFRPVRSVF